MATEYAPPLTPDSATELSPVAKPYKGSRGAARQYWRDPIEEHKDWFSAHGLPPHEVDELLAKHNRIEIEVEEDRWFLDRLKAFLLENYGNTQQEHLYGNISDHMMLHFQNTTIIERHSLEGDAEKASSHYSMQVSRLLPETGSITDVWHSFLRTKSADSTKHVLKGIIPWLVERIKTLQAERDTAVEAAATTEGKAKPSRQKKTNEQRLKRPLDQYRIKKSVKRESADNLIGTRRSQRIGERGSRAGAA